MIDNAEDTAGERKQVTAVFVDIVDFSTIASVADPEDLQVWLEAFYAQVGAVIEAHGGEITEYLGDGIVAVFGLTQADELAALKAIHATDLAVRNFDVSFGQDLPPKLRGGVATGVVAVRNVTPNIRWPRLIGPVTTLAHRVQAHATPGTVLMAPSTEAQLRGHIQVKPLPDRVLKGFDAPITLYESLPMPPSVVASPGKPLIGRKAEIALAHADNRPVLISGQAGIGKTALASQLVHNTGAVTVFQADGLHVGSSYHPFRAWLLRQIGTAQPRWADLVERLTGLEPRDLQCLALMLGLPEGQPLLAEFPNLTLKGLIQTAMARAILAECPSGAWLFEDLHWFDAASFEVVQHILSQPDDAAHRIIMTSRDPKRMDDVIASHRLLHLPLEPLSRDEAAGMLAGLQTDGAAPDLQDRLLDRAAGVPLFLEQLSLRGNAADATVPQTLMGLLAARIDDTQAAKPLLQKVSALGRVFDLRMIRAIAPDVKQPEDHLQACERSGVIRQMAPAEWAFSHALLADAAYQSMLRGQRQAVHGRIADVLEQDVADGTGAEPAILAGHQREARRIVPAIESFLKAANRALLQGSLADGEAHLRAALALCEHDAMPEPRPDLEIEVHTALGSLLMQYQGFTAPRVREAFATVHRIAHAQALPDIHNAAALFGSFSHAIIAADRPKADSFQTMLSDLAQRNDNDPDGHEVQLASLTVDNCASFYKGHFASQFERIAEIRKLYRIEKHASMIARYGMEIFAAAQMFEAPARAISGDVARVPALVAETDAHQDALGIAVMRPYAWIWGAVPLFYAGMLPQARERVGRGLQLAADQGALFWQVTGAAWDHVMRPASEETAETLQQFGAIVDTYEQIGANVGVPYFRAIYASRLADAGQLEAADAASQSAVTDSEASGLHLWYCEVLRHRALVCRALDRPQDAVEALDRAIDHAEGQGAALWLLRALIARAEILPPDAGRIADCLAQFSPQADLPEFAAARSLMDVE